MQHGANIKAHESPIGKHDTTRSGARHSVYRGNNISHSGNETIGIEHNMNITGRAVKSCEHMPNIMEHRPRYKVRTNRKWPWLMSKWPWPQSIKWVEAEQDTKKVCLWPVTRGIKLKQSSGFASTHRRKMSHNDHQCTYMPGFSVSYCVFNYCLCQIMSTLLHICQV